MHMDHVTIMLSKYKPLFCSIALSTGFAHNLCLFKQVPCVLSLRNHSTLFYLATLLSVTTCDPMDNENINVSFSIFNKYCVIHMKHLIFILHNCFIKTCQAKKGIIVIRLIMLSQSINLPFSSLSLRHKMRWWIHIHFFL